MRPYVIIFAACLSLVLFTNSNCGKHHVNRSATQAIITGFDPRMCACCGGLLINFDGDSIPMSGKWHLVKNDPASLGITGSSNFPIHATVTYEMQTPSCPAPDGHGLVLITSIQIR
ncbi:MAG TPA: hypothetical protein VD993_16265 [Chitinophagaceae bacterium]|nr:hypothetical protein [Chitinophagaceae bacterium]